MAGSASGLKVGRFATKRAKVIIGIAQHQQRNQRGSDSRPGALPRGPTLPGPGPDPVDEHGDGDIDQRRGPHKMMRVPQRRQRENSADEHDQSQRRSVEIRFERDYAVLTVSGKTADPRLEGRFRGKVAVAGDSDDVVACADGEEDLRHRGREAHDPPGRTRKRDRPVQRILQNDSGTGCLRGGYRGRQDTEKSKDNREYRYGRHEYVLSPTRTGTAAPRGPPVVRIPRVRDGAGFLAGVARQQCRRNPRNGECHLRHDRG